MPIQQLLDEDKQRQRDEMEKLLTKPSFGGATASEEKHMKIKKIGHCCLIIETKGLRIMTDPGTFTTAQDQEKNIDIIVISHEHADHFHIESVKNVLINNPAAVVVTNTAVGKLLDEHGIAYQVVEHGGSSTVHDILFEGFGEKHGVIYKDMGQVQNTGYFIDNTLFYPGDALTNPEKPIALLALPTAGPFLKLSEVIDYAIALKPSQAFPVHDAIMKSPATFNGWVGMLLEKEGIAFVPLNEGEEHDFS
jgi:L-ascorbate metabolism protein UlaG (beta-lactamase superfamily)